MHSGEFLAVGYVDLFGVAHWEPGRLPQGVEAMLYIRNAAPQAGFSSPLVRGSGHLPAVAAQGTPRVDAVFTQPNGISGFASDYYTMTDLARQLERELSTQQKGKNA